MSDQNTNQVMPKKVVFFSFHIWESRRQGGFHRFARAAWDSGCDVLFLTDSLAWVKTLGKASDRSGIKTILSAVSGSTHENPETNSILRTVACPTLRLPRQLQAIVPGSVREHLSTLFVPSIASRITRFSSEPDCFVFESSAALPLLPRLAKRFPSAKIIYRPSDPLIGNPNILPAMKRAEMIAVKTADRTLVVNERGRQLYIEQFELTEAEVKRLEIVPNGVDVTAYRRVYDRPEVMRSSGKIACYVGAMQPNWEAILHLAAEIPDIKVVIVCPEPLPHQFVRRVEQLPNLIYVPGVAPAEVPAYISNCDVFISPYPDDLYRTKPWGLLAKLMQAMAATRPVVCLNMDLELRDYGLKVVYSSCDFITAVQDALGSGPVNYDFDFTLRDWTVCEKTFISALT